MKKHSVEKVGDKTVSTRQKNPTNVVHESATI